MNVNESQVIGANEAIVSNVVVETEKRLKVAENYRSKNSLLYAIVKRFIDIIGGIVGVILLCPLTICVYIANKIARDNGPIFYSQERIGKNGKKFKIYKYRSMVVDAEERLEKYLLENREARTEWEENKKLKNDPRITRVGNFIRKTSVDEFPQFINVLKGDMSLVGPRPYLPNEQADMGVHYNNIILKKPGITGFWQVNGRSNVSFEERLNMDCEYCLKSSTKLDIKILFKTVSSVIKREGAV